MSRVFTAASTNNLEGSSAVRATAPITIAAWIKPSSTSGTSVIAIQSLVSTVSDYFGLIRHSDATCYAQAHDSSGGDFAISTATTAIGTWSHICGVFASTTSRSIYINGANKVTNTSFANPAGINATVVGARYAGVGLFEYGMDGDIAEVAVWDIALSDAEVASLFISPGVGVYPSDVQPGHLVGYWKLIGVNSPEPATVGSLPLTVHGAVGGTHLTMQNIAGGAITLGSVAVNARAGESLPPFSLPALPTLYDTTYTTPTGATLTAANASELQTRLSSSSPGDVIMLTPGATYSGHFSLPNKVGASSYVVIRPSSTLTTEGVQVTTAQAAAFPKIVTPDTAAAIQADPSSSYYRFINCDITSGSTAVNGAVLALGPDGSVTIDPATFPHHIIFDRCYIHGNATNGGRRGIMFAGSYQAVIDSYVSDWKEVGADTQAIGCWTGYGPYKIVNNYLEAAAENILFGGAGTGNVTNLTPSDIEIRGNTFFKPLTWKQGHPSYAGTAWSIKNLLELKHAKRVLIQDNLFENCWVGADQQGYAVLFTVRNQTGSTPWATVSDVTFRNNEIRNSDNGINMLGYDTESGIPSDYAKRLLISDNVMTNIGGTWYGDGNLFLIARGYQDVTIDHNTCLHDPGVPVNGSVVYAYSIPNPRFRFINNIVQHNANGITGDTYGTGNPSIDVYFPGSLITKNVFQSPAVRTDYPAGQYWPVNLAAIGFTNYPTDLSLSPSSTYNNLGTDGTDIGAVFASTGSAFNPAWAASCNQLVV